MAKEDLKIAVMFFSATGNSKNIAYKIAAYLAARFKEKAALIDITHRLKEPKNAANNEFNPNKNDLQYYDLLFVVLPVYSQLCPTPIAQFLKKLQFRGMIVPCVSYGSVSAGKALRQISRIFQKKGAVLLAGAEFASSHFYYNCGGLDCGNNEDLNRAIALKENLAVNELCSKVIDRLDKGFTLKKPPIRHFNPLSLVFPRTRAQIGVRLKCLDKNKCAECKRCKSICPYDAINNNLKASGKCQRCGYCIKNCKDNNKQFVIRPLMLRYLKKNINYSRNSQIY